MITSGLRRWPNRLGWDYRRQWQFVKQNGKWHVSFFPHGECVATKRANSAKLRDAMRQARAR